MRLEELWGADATDRLADALTIGDFGRPTLAEPPAPDGLLMPPLPGQVSLAVVWDGARGLLEAHAHDASFARLDADDGRRRQGIVTGIVRGLLPLFLDLGVRAVTIVPGDNEGLFARVGFERQPHGPMIGLVEPGCRFEQYVEWKDGRAEEPDWHRRLGG